MRLGAALEPQALAGWGWVVWQRVYSPVPLISHPTDGRGTHLSQLGLTSGVGHLFRRETPQKSDTHMNKVSQAGRQERVSSLLPHRGFLFYWFLFVFVSVFTLCIALAPRQDPGGLGLEAESRIQDLWLWTGVRLDME